jgi:hypothetical protein
VSGHRGIRIGGRDIAVVGGGSFGNRTTIWAFFLDIQAYTFLLSTYKKLAIIASITVTYDKEQKVVPRTLLARLSV